MDSTAPSTGYHDIEIGRLIPSPLNPRQHFDGVEELAENIARQGVLVPLLVRPRKNITKSHGGHAGWTSYEIVDGERRYRAAVTAGTVTTLPAIVRELPDDEVLEIQLLSAIQRQALTPLEEARGYRRLLDSNPAKYSAAYIADRISRSERYVVDRMRLLALIPALQGLLDTERIGVAHAELLAKLKPEDQERAADLGGGGLWQAMSRTLYDDEAEHEEGADPYAGLKAVTVKELEAWIARHVRFDVAHFAETAPLEFGETAIKVEGAQQQPGRGKKVIQISTDYRPNDDVRKDGGERIYGQPSWKRADGTEGTSRGGRYGEKPADSPTCEHSVLGVIVAGPGYGTAFPVCIARDRCKVHWKAEIKEREQRAKERESGTSTKGASKPTENDWQAQQRRETAERKRAAAAYQVVYPQIVNALTAVLPRSFTDPRMLAYLWDALELGDPPDGDALAEDLPAALVLAHMPEADPGEYSVSFNLKECLRILRVFGGEPERFDQAFKAQVKALAKADAEKAKPSAAKKPATAKPAKKAAAKKGGRK